MAMSVLDPHVKVGLLFALFFLPMLLEVYVFGKNLLKEPLGKFFEYLLLSNLVTVLVELHEWYTMCAGPCPLNSFKMITKLCLDIAFVILYMLGIIGFFKNMGFYIKTWFSGVNIIVLALYIVWKIAYDLFGACREAGTPQTSTPRGLENGYSPTRAHSENASGSSSGTPQTPSPQESRQLENGNIGSNTDENESDGSEIDNEEKTVDGNLVANISPEDGFSEAAQNSSALEIENKEQTVNRNPVVTISPSEANAINSPACVIDIKAQIINGNSVANISPEDAFSEANAQEPPGFETDLEAESIMENYQSPCARIYKWMIMLGDRLGVGLMQLPLGPR